jgi:phosphoenolpyruvate-protein phosphotransferase (PTS system enzyme I)
MQELQPQNKQRRVARGIAAAPGVAIGPAFVLDEEKTVVSDRHLQPSEIARELEKYDKALDEARRQITSLREKVRKDVGDAESHIFDAHLLILQDSEFSGKVRADIQSEHREGAFLLRRRAEDLRQRMMRFGDAYLKERASDIEDVSERVIGILNAGSRRRLLELPCPSILVGHSLSPSTLTQLKVRNLLGIATDLGGPTSHVAILARSLRIPSVSGLNTASLGIKTGTMIALDGSGGVCTANPSEKERSAIRDRQHALERLQLELFSLRDLPAQTMDGRELLLSSNIELPVEADNALSVGSHGIGLYRTEFIYMAQKTLPSEEEQLSAYRYILERLDPRPVTLRTLDAGGDKLLGGLDGGKDENPFMGWRSIRICLEREDIFRTQLRAILRASAYGQARIMFPMIADIRELKEAKKILADVRKELAAQDVPMADKIPVGAMIEIPSAVLQARHLAKECDFFSIGTNDLTQFTLAVDRGNRRISHLYDPLSPAVLEMIHMTVEAARPTGTLVCVCGEMASDPAGAYVLTGLGVDELSMAPWSILEIKKLLRSINWEDARNAAEACRMLPGSADVRKYLTNQMRRKISGLGLSSSLLGIGPQKSDSRHSE